MRRGEVHTVKRKSPQGQEKVTAGSGAGGLQGLSSVLGWEAYLPFHFDSSERRTEKKKDIFPNYIVQLYWQRHLGFDSGRTSVLCEKADKQLSQGVISLLLGHVFSYRNLDKVCFLSLFSWWGNWATAFWLQFSSVARSCSTLCDHMNCTTPGLPVHHQLPEFTQTHAHRVNDAIHYTVVY